MNAIDFSIIYFACGAPLAAYYFLNSRTENKTFLFWLKIFSVFFFWLPFAVSLLRNRRHLFSAFRIFEAPANDATIERISRQQKRIEKILLKSDLEISIFDLRETVERYAGLSLAVKNESGGESEKEIFRAAESQNVELGAICLYRRNRSRLVRHQTEARRDFLQLVRQLLDARSDVKVLENSALEIVELLEDRTARQNLEKMFAASLQTGKINSVEQTEKDLWKPQEHKPLRTETISTL